MKHYLSIILTALAVTLAAGTYTLDDLVTAGLNDSYAMRQKEIMRQNSGLSLRSAAWNLLPSAEVSASRTNRDGDHSSQASLEFARTLSLTEPAWFNYKSAKIDQGKAALDWRQTRKETVYSIYSAWLDLDQLNREIAIQTENLTVLQKVREQTALQQSLGQRTVYDVRQAEINYINTQLAISELNNQLAAQRARLFNLVKLEDDGSDLAFDTAEEAALAIDFSAAGDENMSLQQIREDIRMTRLSKLQQKLSLFPSLYLSGRYGQYSNNNDLLAFSDYEDSYTLSAGLSWSLWTPWTKGSGYAQTANSLALKEMQLDEETAGLRLDRDNLKREWNHLLETLSLNARKSTQAKDNLAIAQEKYRLGALSLIELEQARVDALEAELAVNKITFQLQKKTQEWNLLNSMPILNKY